MRIHILTLFPDMFQGPFHNSIVKRAVDSALVEIHLHDIRQYTHDRHHTADDYQFGGDSGMVMKPEPIFEGVESILSDLTQLEMARTRVILTSPQGRLLDQSTVEELARQLHLIVICGHYEGVDERVREHLITDEVSIGDYVLTGGELAAMVLTDAVVRLLPGVVGSEASVRGDSITSGLLQHPIYTRPAQFQEWGVPEVLLSGNHQEIKRWRRERSLERTFHQRPDLLARAKLTSQDIEFLGKLGFKGKENSRG
ncbi:MAG: tRNA (guanosine(37)-N1)-methyltransferase TrmD [Dehalococcoidia bacterium]